jgi:hypothetical protein
MIPQEQRHARVAVETGPKLQHLLVFAAGKIDLKPEQRERRHHVARLREAFGHGFECFV